MCHLVLLLSLFLTGCKIIALNTDPIVTGPTLSISNPATESDVAYVWLPTANTGTKVLYREAFDNNVSEFVARYQLNNISPKLQNYFDDFIIESGGAYDTQTGKLKSKLVVSSLQSTYKLMLADNSALKRLVVLSPIKHSTRVEGGDAKWHGVKQSMTVKSHSLIEHRNVMSIDVLYYHPDEDDRGFLVGLDMHAPDLKDDTKYFDVIKHIFKPVVLWKEK